MRPQEHQSDPNVNDKGDAEGRHFVPPHGEVLRGEDSCRADVAGKIEVVRVEVWDC